jgi:hypothetical protein
MLKKLIAILSFIFICPIAFAGQGLFLKLHSYIPDASVDVLEGYCVDGYKQIKMNQTTYLEAYNTCWDNWVKFSLKIKGVEVAKYKLNISFSGSSLSPNKLIRKDGKVIVASLYPHTGLVGTQDRVVISIANAEDDWMKQSAENIANRKLRELILPGTHNSGTSGINSNSEITDDMDARLRTWINLDPMKITHLSNWSITQKLNIDEQLDLGIRYIDLRLCKSTKGEFVTCHSLSGLSLETIFEQIESFLKNPNHDKELLLLDFNHVYEIKNADIDTLAMKIKKRFGDKIASSNVFHSKNTLADFWDAKKQIIILMDNGYACETYPELFWSEARISSPWPDKQDPASLEKALENELKLHSFNKFFVLQTQETPSVQNIIEGFNPAMHPNSLLKMTTGYKHKLEEWLNRAEIKASIKYHGGVIIEDFTNGVDLTEYAKELNK